MKKVLTIAVALLFIVLTVMLAGHRHDDAAIHVDCALCVVVSTCGAASLQHTGLTVILLCLFLLVIPVVVVRTHFISAIASRSPPASI